MTTREAEKHREEVREQAFDDTDFNPIGALTLTLGYLGIVILAWGSVYLFELLARR